MRDINTVVPKVARALAHGDEPEKVSLKAVNDVFKAMHGSYGKQFLEKFATGIQDAGGHDEGIKSARMAWAHALKRFDIDVVGLALDRMRTVHPVWAPALGEFEALCVIAEGELRAKERVDEALKALPCSGEAFSAATRQDIQAPRTWQLGNAAINRLLWTPDGLSLVGWADTQHLDNAVRDENHA